MTPDGSRSARRTDALSRERVITAAIEILDAEGETALTFRALAGRLSTGTGSIYWYVANKDELLAAATNVVLGPVLDSVQTPDAPREQVRATALGLFDALDLHPWVGLQLAREPSRQGATRIFEAVGQRVQALGVPREAQFDAASALTSYILGSASQNAAHARTGPQALGRDAFLSGTAERWAKLDAAEYPFVHEVMEQLPRHDDRAQFLAGIDFILAGLRLASR